jgi:hypothetical protein
LDSAADAEAAVCSNGGSVLLDGVLELDDFVGAKTFKRTRRTQHPLESGAAANDACGRFRHSLC